MAVSAFLALLVIAAAGPAPAGPLDGFNSENVEFIGNISEIRLAGGVLHDDYFYVAGSSRMAIYDVSRAGDPREVASLPRTALASTQVADTDPETNGEILLCNGCDESRPGVFDVRDKQQLERIAQLPYAHHWSCVLDCEWAYSNDGQVVDLRNPRQPLLSPSFWNAGLETRVPAFYELIVGAGFSHDVTEVAPGIVLTASVPMYLLDARRDPTHPRVLAKSDGSAYSYGHVAWPDFRHGGFALSNNEAGFAQSRCEINDALEGSSLEAAFKTWDGSEWKKDGLLTGLDTYSASNGTYADGDPAVSGPVYDPATLAQWGCAPAVFDAHPDFRHNGVVAHAWYGHGVKFLTVGRDGEIEPVGYFLGHGANAISVDWITDEILYVSDFNRGIDILRFTDAGI